MQITMPTNIQKEVLVFNFKPYIVLKNNIIYGIRNSQISNQPSQNDEYGVKWEK